jgi:hypothetical protein
MTSDEREQLAKQRFFLLSAMRFPSLIFVALGVANVGGRLFPEWSPYLGYLFLIIAMVEFFYVPVMLKKAWARQDAEIG